MISSLYIQNYALIDQIELKFGPGLNIITGETGAGKSIILGALTLILGKRADTSVLYRKDKKCVVEGNIAIKNYQLEAFFKENGLDYDHELIIRREIAVAGKSRAFINDTPVNLAILSKLSKKLIDLHLQFDTLEIRDSRYQLHLLDLVSENLEKVNTYHTLFKKYNHNLSTLREWTERQKQSLKEQDYFLFLSKELEHAAFEENEQEKLESQMARSKNLDAIKNSLITLLKELDDNEYSIVPLLRSHENQIQNIAEIDDELDKLHISLKNIIAELVDLHFETEKLYTNYQESPLIPTEIEERLELIYKLQHKHQVNSLGELLEIQSNIADRINKIQSIEDNIEELKRTISAQRKTMEQLANTLHSRRKSAIPRVEAFIMDQLANMGIPHARLEVRLDVQKDLNSTGKDIVEFLFAANEGSDMLALRKVASGGEISRLNLALKTLIANEIDLPSLVFDEIDSGISGEIAQRLGNILHNLAKRHQIISITHSPQVASRASKHFKVFKMSEDGKTTTKISILGREERIVEIAKMLSGDPPIPAAIENAKELISAN